MGRRADCDGPSDVCRAIQVLPTGIDQQERVRFNTAIGFFRHAIVDDCAIRASARNRVKGYVAQSVGGATEAFKRTHHVNLGQSARKSLFVEPAQELHHRGAVAQMCLSGRGDFSVCFLRLRQDARVIAPRHFDASVVQCQANGHWRGGLVDPDGAFELCKFCEQGVWLELGDRRVRSQCLGFGKVHKKRHCCIVMKKREGLHYRVSGNVASTNVQQPTNAVRQAEKSCLVSGLLQKLRHALSLLSRRLTCELCGISFCWF